MFATLRRTGKPWIHYGDTMRPSLQLNIIGIVVIIAIVVLFCLAQCFKAVACGLELCKQFDSTAYLCPATIR